MHQRENICKPNDQGDYMLPVEIRDYRLENNKGHPENTGGPLRLKKFCQPNIPSLIQLGAKKIQQNLL